MTRIDGPDELLAAVLNKAIADLATPCGRHSYTAAVFLDEAGLLERVCRARGVDYERAVTALIDGPPATRGHR